MSIRDQLYKEIKEQIENLKIEIENNNIILDSLLKELEELNQN